MNVVRHKIVNSRKSSLCFGCALEYPPGTQMERIAFSVENKILTVSYCPICRNYWDKYLESDDEISCGDLRFQDPDEWKRLRDEYEKSNLRSDL